MNITNAKKAAELVSAIESVSKYKEMLENKMHGKVAHFELVQHFGENPARLVFDEKYTPFFINVAEQIYKRLNEELSSL